MIGRKGKLVRGRVVVTNGDLRTWDEDHHCASMVMWTYFILPRGIFECICTRNTLSVCMNIHILGASGVKWNYG